MKAVFFRPEFHAAFQSLLDDPIHLGPVVRVNVLQAPLRVWRGGFRGIMKHLLKTFAPPDFIGPQVPIPHGVFGGPGHELEAFFAFPQGLFCLLAYGEIARDPDDAGHAPCLIFDRHLGSREPARLAIRSRVEFEAVDEGLTGLNQALFFVIKTLSQSRILKIEISLADGLLRV